MLITIKPSIQACPDLQEHRPSPSTLDLMVVWTQAYDLWLESRRSSNTRRAYRMAWESTLDSTSKLPWEISKSDVALWVNQLRADRLSPAIIHQRMAAVMSFYTPANQGLHRGRRWRLPITHP